jgi:hypothetical protein
MNYSLNYNYSPYLIIDSIISLISKSIATNNRVYITSKSKRNKVYYI